MRFCIMLIAISAISVKTVCGFFSYKTEDRDSIKISKQKNNSRYKTILIGNVTEFSYGYDLIIPETVWGDSVNTFNNPRVNSWALTQYFIVNNYLIQSGIGYSTTVADYKMDYSWNSIVSKQVLVSDTINTHYYIVDGDSIAEHVIEEHTVTKTDTSKITISDSGKNKISCITIPLNIGYRWRFEHFALYYKLGAQFNFVTSAKGRVYIADNQEWQVLDETIEKEFYLSTTTSIAFEYPFSELGSLIIEPRYHYNWNSQANSGFSKNHHQLGVKLGLQFWF